MPFSQYANQFSPSWWFRTCKFRKGIVLLVKYFAQAPNSTQIVCDVYFLTSLANMLERSKFTLLLYQFILYDFGYIWSIVS